MTPREILRKQAENLVRRASALAQHADNVARRAGAMMHELDNGEPVDCIASPGSACDLGERFSSVAETMGRVELALAIAFEAEPKPEPPIT